MRAAAERVAAHLASAGVKAKATAQSLGIVCRVAPGEAVAALEALRDARFEMLVDAFATDTGRKLELTYHLRRCDDGREVYVRSRFAYDAVQRSASSVFPCAANAEREAAELYGMTFTGMPDMHRLLTTTDTAEPPMRKSARQPKERMPG